MSTLTKIVAGLAVVLGLAMGATSLALCQSASLRPSPVAAAAPASALDVSAQESPMPPDPWDIQLDAPRPY